ncbi:unnamed protein product [Protopolystoma xenopodis]|uniref:Uncharacterized protein n=1 Tax=Protopolystoma xenopodis TaxID=117903 RepID=A0A3S5CUU9_9PLAT|nr:unnamed protein product [Protopolystoma xenopodis]
MRTAWLGLVSGRINSLHQSDESLQPGDNFDEMTNAQATLIKLESVCRANWRTQAQVYTHMHA